ncbi:hypothetical protein AB1Y20_000705 [Prymnesium parvum]|uniref:Uncharacterized protein n=1 Tax=Prymnesium parvum TaxID=97485 RepID=A0AB34K669_PRYPA
MAAAAARRRCRRTAAVVQAAARGWGTLRPPGVLLLLLVLLPVSPSSLRSAVPPSAKQMEHARAIPPPRSTCVSPPQLLERRPLLCTPSVRSASVALRANGLSVVVVLPRAAPSASFVRLSLPPSSPSLPGDGPFTLRSRLLTALDPSIAPTASGTPTFCARRACVLRPLLSAPAVCALCCLSRTMAHQLRLASLLPHCHLPPCGYSLLSTCLSPTQPLERRPLLCTPSVCSASVAVRASCPSIVLPRWGGVSFQVSLSL